MSETEIVELGDDAAGELICNLKAAVTALECQHKMYQMKELTRQKPEKPRSPPMYMMIPIEQNSNCDGSIDCNGRTMKSSRNHRNRAESDTSSISSSKSRRGDECKSKNGGSKLRGGVLHTRCGCIHRDGLQDKCPLTECRGRPECKTLPWPTCRPAKDFYERYPDMAPIRSNHNAMTC